MRSRMLLLVAILFVASSAHASSIVDAARRGDHHRVRQLLKEDPALVGETDAQGYTALHWAGIRAQWYVFGQLLEASAPVDALGGDGGTPLHWACHHDNAAAVRALLDAGADLAVSNRWGRTALHVAARRGCAQVAALLLERGADPDAPTREGWTPLHVAHKSGHPALVELLLAHGADPERVDEAGDRPAEVQRERPPRIELPRERLREYAGLYTLEGGHAVKVWLDDAGLHLREFAPDDLLPIGEDRFACRAEPWIVRFLREEGAIVAVELDYLRRTVRAERSEAPRYVGSAACRECHLEGGGPYLQWVRSRHAAAYWRLKTDWALLLGLARPYYKDLTDPAADDRCLLCHLTGAQDDDAILEASYRPEEGIGCESCHGPGSAYMDPEIMADREAFLAVGGRVPGRSTCVEGCHRNPEFDFEAQWPKIAHGAVAEQEHP